jgi:C4-dicarboxylate-specific signal transduction histidine kinase
MIISANAALTRSYDHLRVALSAVIAVSASYAALDLAGRVTAATGWVRLVWLTGGAVAMGLGIWSDSGIGLDPQQRDHIFEPFFTTRLEGIGMGLSISRSIVESHGGRLWAESGPNGALFQFTLPAQVGNGVP